MADNGHTANGRTSMAAHFAAGIVLFAAFAANCAAAAEGLFDGAEWIGEAPGMNAAAPRFSTTFKADKDGPAEIAVCGLGQYVATLNGRPLGRGDEFNLPGWTRTSKTCFYNVFSPVLKAGEENTLEITLGNGMYNVEPPGKGLYTKFTGSEGPKKLIVGGAVKSSTRGWTVSPSEVVRTHVYCGDDIDRRFSAAEAKREKPARVPAPAGKLVEAPFTCRLQEVRKPVRIMKVSDAELTVDFGQNAAYVPKIVAAGPRSSRVEIEFSEIPLAPGETRITKNPGGYHGTVARCAFTLAGEGDESFETPFFYYGFRYMKVRLFEAEKGGALPRLVDAEARVVMADAPPAGSFKCSLGLFDKIHDICRWSQRSNMQNVFTDCPHREKLGWQEQNHIHADQIRWGWSAEALFAKTCRDLADSQLPDGMVPDIAPEYTVFKGGFRHSIEWGSAIIQIPWQQYEWTGDDSLIREYWKNMVAYHEYIRSKSRDEKRGLFITPGGLGDWYQQTVSSDKRPARRTSHDFTATAFYFLNAETLAKCAHLLGRKAEAAAFREEAANIKKAFNGKWWKAGEHCYENNSQTANAIALAFGLADPGETAAIVSNIVEDVRGRGAVGTGEIGYPYLLKTLMENGCGDVIYEMTADDTKPGYGYMIAKGNTTCHEAWDCREGSSFNHFMMADIVNWFYEGLAGIKRTSPGFATFAVQPEFHAGLDWVKASHAVKGGEIRVEWRRTDAGIEVAVAVPEGSVAAIRLPGLPETRQGPGEKTYLVAGATAVVSGETATLSNGLASVSFDVKNGTFTIRDAEGRVRLADAGVGATSVKRGAAFTATTDEVNDAFGHGARITFTVRDDTAGARWGFHDAGYQHPHSKGAWEPVYTYTLYDGSPALIASFGVNTPVWYRRRLMGATVVRGGKWLGGDATGTSRPADFVTINSAAGAEPAHIVPGLSRNSANGVIVTGLVDGKRRTLVAGGLQYDAFGKMAELDDGALTLYAADEVGVLVEPGTNRLFSADTFYIDAVTDDPFASAEAYGRAMRKANGANPNVYDFPLLCGWAVGALSKLGNINNAPALVKELDMANEKGFTKYSKVGVRLEPDYYCYGNKGNTEQGWYDDAHWARYGHLRQPYETFAKWCAAIKERNGIPYTYFQVGMPSDDFAIAHRDWMIFNSTNRIERKHMHHRPYVTYDFTDKGMADHMLATWKRLRKDGMQGVKFDYPETGYNPQGGFDDIHASATQAYRRYFALAREGLGKEAFLDERNLGECGRPCLDVTAGIVDTQRTWNDSNKFDPHMITTDGLRWFKMRTVFNYYPDSKAIHGLLEGVRRSMLTTVYLTSGRIELATSFRLFTPEMTHDLSRLYPEYREPFAARPIDAFKKGVANPTVYDLELAPTWHQVMLFNPEKKRATVKTALCGDRATDGALGLDPQAKWRVHSFWDDVYLGILGAGDALEIEMNGLECEIFRVTKAETRPQVVSTTRHVLQGWMDVADEKWDAAGRVLSGTAKHIASGTTESVVVAADTADGKVFPLVRAEVSPEDSAAGVKVSAVETDGTVRVALAVPTAREVKWRIVFGEPCGGAVAPRQPQRLRR